mgnify:CR=1 FL=1
MKINVATGVPGIKVDIDVDSDSHVAIESHAQNITIMRRAGKEGDTMVADTMAPIYDMDKDDARNGALSMLRTAASCKDRKARMAYKRLAMKGLRNL